MRHRRRHESPEKPTLCMNYLLSTGVEALRDLQQRQAATFSLSNVPSLPVRLGTVLVFLRPSAAIDEDMKVFTLPVLYTLAVLVIVDGGVVGRTTAVGVVQGHFPAVPEGPGRRPDQAPPGPPCGVSEEPPADPSDPRARRRGCGGARRGCGPGAPARPAAQESGLPGLTRGAPAPPPRRCRQTSA